MTTEAAVKSRDSERHPTVTPAMVSGVHPAEHVAGPVEGVYQFECTYNYKMNISKLMQLRINNKGVS